MVESLKKLLAPALFVAALAFPLASEAQANQPNCRTKSVNARQGRQTTRIRQGVRSGELTRRETQRLAAEQAVIRTQEAFYRRSGGEFTARERARVQRELQQSSKHIYKQKHDRQDRN
ncbi:MAG: hypothetical protein H0W76_13105 [Pyrinomonadaceae bacterium]|nr:hypothetical protein [Pyrinomonadaceae bacterium]